MPRRLHDGLVQDTFRSSSDMSSGLSSFSGDHSKENVAACSQASANSDEQRFTTTWKSKLRAFWVKNKGLVLVLISQFFGTVMVVITRLLETSDSDRGSMEPFQILFARMSITSVLCLLYMWWTNVPDAPFGKRDIRLLLVLRGIGGFFGVYGIYYALVYLPLAEATVITFLAPLLTCWICSILLHEPFSRVEQIAGIVSLLGVVLIAQPTSIFRRDSSSSISMSPNTANNTTLSIRSDADNLSHVTPMQRIIAIGVSLIGVCGAACAYTTIRCIGDRAHPLISVNYFAVWCTAVSTLALAFVPSVPFRLPIGLYEWTLLIFMGFCGFVMQFLLTAGLAHEKSSRATSMVYTSMIFALIFDKVIWNQTPGLASAIGGVSILGSAAWVAAYGASAQANVVKTTGSEEAGLVAGEEGYEEEDDSMNLEVDGRALTSLQEVQLKTIRV